MSTIPGEVRLGEATVRRRPALPTGAWFYFAAVVAVTTAGAALLLPRIHDGRSGSAWGVAQLVLGHAPGWVDAGPRTAVAGLAACVVFVGLNHALMAGIPHSSIPKSGG
jgi:hypothetical protein